MHMHGFLLCGFETAAAEHGCKFEPRIDGAGVNTAPLMSPQDMGKNFRFDALSSAKDLDPSEIAALNVPAAAD